MTHAQTFRSLHAGPDVLVLTNCWDAFSAKLIASHGARALATSSAAVAWTHGYPDGDALPIELHLQTLRAIRRVIDLPLSVDSEGGYADDPAQVAATIARFVDAGAVGINIEDGAKPVELLAEKIAAIKRALGDAVFVNARTDVYLRALVPAPDRVRETCARAAKLRAAGADGLFVPGVVDAEEIRTLAAEVVLPLNVLARAGVPNAAALGQLGARRLSAGSGLAQWAWGHLGARAKEFAATGDSAKLLDGSISYATINPQFT